MGRTSVQPGFYRLKISNRPLHSEIAFVFLCRSLCMDFLPPSSGVFRLALARSSPGIPSRRSCGFQGSMRSCRKHITIIQAFLGRIRSGFEGEKRTWEVRFLWTALDRAYHNNTQIFRRWYFRFCAILNVSTTIFIKQIFLQEICLFSGR